VKNPTVATYPKGLNTVAKRALYDNLGKNEGLALALDAEILRTKRDDWRGHPIKEKEVKNAIKGTLKTFGIEEADELSRVFELVKKQDDY
jgi:type I restriction enzyme R subunit